MEQQRTVARDGVIPVVNGEERTVAAGSTLGDFLRELVAERGRRGGRAQPRDRSRPVAPRHNGARDGRLGGDRPLRRWRMTESTLIAGGTDTPFVIAGRALRSRLMVGTGKYRSHDEMVRAHRSVGRRGGDGRGAPRGSDRDSDDGVLAAPRPDALLPAREHGRLLHRGGRRALRASRARRGIQRVGEARGHRRPGDAAPRHRGAARGDAHPRRRWLQGDGVHERRSHHRAPSRGCRRCRGDAARVADRLGARAAQPVLDPHDQASAVGAGDRRCRRRHRERRVHHDGAGCRRHPDEHRASQPPTIRCAWRTRCALPSRRAARRISPAACRAAKSRCRRRPSVGMLE